MEYFLIISINITHNFLQRFFLIYKRLFVKVKRMKKEPYPQHERQHE